MYLWQKLNDYDPSQEKSMKTKKKMRLNGNRIKVKLDKIEFLDDKITIYNLKKHLNLNENTQMYHHVKRKRKSTEETIVQVSNEFVLMSGQTFSIGKLNS